MVALAASTCKKKNYPKDIPKWLKEKIDGMNKDYTKQKLVGGEKLCNHIVPREVREYTDGSSTFYMIGSSYGGYKIYNYDGQWVCDYFSFGSGQCSNYRKTLVRKIWEEDCR